MVELIKGHYYKYINIHSHLYILKYIDDVSDSEPYRIKYKFNVICNEKGRTFSNIEGVVHGDEIDGLIPLTKAQVDEEIVLLTI